MLLLNLSSVRLQIHPLLPRLAKVLLLILKLLSSRYSHSSLLSASIQWFLILELRHDGKEVDRGSTTGPLAPSRPHDATFEAS
jgi:hypothetical protein